MGSIPLPALHVNPPAPQQDPMENYSRMLALRQMMQTAPLRQQEMQQQVQAGALENQQKQQQMNDLHAATTAMQGWDGNDYKSIIPAMIKNGASAQAVMGMKQKILEQQQSISTMVKNNGEGAAAQMNAVKTKGDLLDGALAPLIDPKQVPDQQLPQAVMSTAQDLVQKGVLDPQHAQQAEQLAQSGDPNKIRQALDLMRKTNMAQSQITEEALKKAQTGEAGARANEATVNAGLAPAKLAQQQANEAIQRRQEQQRIGLESQRLGVEGAKLNLDRQKSGLDNSGSASSLSKAIAQGHITPDRMGYLLSRNPGLIDGVMKEDPSFDQSKAQAYPATYKDFTSGKTSVALNAGATALGHLKELADMNTNASHIPGTPDYNAYQNKADTVSSELAKFYGDATIPAIASIKKTLTATLPGNRQAAIRTQAQSMGDKLDSFQQTWDNAAPSKAYQAPMPGISAKAQAARTALAGGGQGSTGNSSGGGALTVKAPNGKTYSFKDQASADAFKQKAGIQ